MKQPLLGAAFNKSWGDFMEMITIDQKVIIRILQESLRVFVEKDVDIMSADEAEKYIKYLKAKISIKKQKIIDINEYKNL